MQAHNLLTTGEALELIGWRSRSSLYRAEKAGRIRRVRTLRRRPLWRREDIQKLSVANAPPAPADVEPQHQFEDDELARHRMELGRLLAAGELDGTPALRLMVA